MTRLEENEGGGTVGVGLTFSPVGLDASARLRADRRLPQRPGVALRRRGGGCARSSTARCTTRRCTRRARPTSAGTGSRRRGGAEVERRDRRARARGRDDAAAEAVIGLRREGAGGRSPSISAARRRARGRPRRASRRRRVRRASLVADVTWERGDALELVLRTASERRRAGSRRSPRGSTCATRRAARSPSGCSCPGGTRDDLRAFARRIAHCTGSSSAAATTRASGGGHQPRRPARRLARAVARARQLRAPARRRGRLGARRPRPSKIRLPGGVTVRNLRRTS